MERSIVGGSDVLPYGEDSSAVAKRGTVAHLEQIAIQEPPSFCGLLGKVLPMTIADTAQNEERKYVFESRIVYPKDKDGNIIWPDWAKDKSGRPLPINRVSPESD